jgi:hypothetical protein
MTSEQSEPRRPVTTLSGLASLAAVAICLAGATGSAIAQPTSGSIAAGAGAFAYDSNLPKPPADDVANGASWSGSVTSPLDASADAYQSVDDSTGSGFSHATANASATWAANGLSGTMDYNYTMASNWDPAILGGVNNVPLPLGDTTIWEYQFTAEKTGDFVLNFSTSVSGQPFGFKSFALGGIISTTDTYLDTSTGGSGPAGLDNTGQFLGLVTAGDSYDIYLGGAENNYSGGGSDLNWSGASSGDFSWTLPGGSNSVPDGGATAAMLGMGVAGLACLRRRFARDAVL